MTIYGYVRISAADPEGLLKTQLTALRKAGCDEDNFFIDQRTGVAGHRPAYNRMLDKLQPGDQVLVWTLDRIGRSISNVALVVEQIASRGASLRSLGEDIHNIDTNPASNTGHSALFAMLRDFSHRIDVERGTANQGRKKVPGDGKWRLALTREQVLLAQNVFKYKTMSVKELLKDLNVSSPTLYEYVGPGGDLRPRGVRAVAMSENADQEAED